MILESIVTTVDEQGRINLAPMGPVVSHPNALSRVDDGDPGFILRPFEGSTTLRNLIQTKRATIHISDDVELFAAAAIGKVDAEHLVQSGFNRDWKRLKDCHRWFEVEINQIQSTPPRHEMHCRVVRSGLQNPFFGFNRAKHAVLEVAILATRLHLIPAQEVERHLRVFEPMVQKTAGPAERRAFDLLKTHLLNDREPPAANELA